MQTGDETFNLYMKDINIHILLDVKMTNKFPLLLSIKFYI
jgi:hypothetical protein